MKGMIENIKKVFHTDKWWGRTILVFLIYILYWCIFYGSWFIMPGEWFDKNSDLSGILFLIFIVIIVPIISFFIPKFIKKVFEINKHFLYPLHIFLIILSVALFLVLGIIKAFSHIQIG